MSTTFEIAVFEGDGIGAEIMGSTVGVLTQLAPRKQSLTRRSSHRMFKKRL